MVNGEEVRLSVSSPQPSKLREKKKDTFEYDIIEFSLRDQSEKEMTFWEAIKVRASIFI